MKNLLKKTFLLVTLTLSVTYAYAQSNSRKYIKDCISGWGECRSVAITKRNGDAAIYGRNGSARSGCPQGFVDVLVRLHDQGRDIKDICLTESGSYLVLYDRNDCSWSGIPSAMKEQILEYNRNGEEITTATFCDDGDWIVVTTEHISASNSDIQEWLHDGNAKYGKLWTACVTEECIVAVYEEGYRFRGDVPQSLKDALDETDMDVYCVKVAGSSWFFSNKNGRYRYYM